MTNEDIRDLVQLVKETGIAELEVQRGEDRVRIRASIPVNTDLFLSHSASTATPSQPQPTLPSQAATLAASSGAGSLPAASDAPDSGAQDEVIVRSPIVGTYYDAPKPGDPPFVRIGEQVEPGQVLCIIESMKLMNEIESEISGTVVRKLTENARPVEYGEALFAVRPR